MAALYDFEAMSHEELLGTAEGLRAAVDDLTNSLRREKQETEKVSQSLSSALLAAVLSAGGEIKLTDAAIRSALSDDYLLVEVTPGDVLSRERTLKALRKDGKK